MDESTRMFLMTDTKICLLELMDDTKTEHVQGSILGTHHCSFVTMSPPQLGIERFRFTLKSRPTKSAQGTKKDVVCQKSKGHVVLLVMQCPHKEGLPAQTGPGKGKETAVKWL